MKLSTSLVIEEEAGTSSGWIHTHIGYYSGNLLARVRRFVGFKDHGGLSVARSWHRGAAFFAEAAG